MILNNYPHNDNVAPCAMDLRTVLWEQISASFREKLEPLGWEFAEKSHDIR